MLIISQGHAYENICIQFCTTFLLCFSFCTKIYPLLTTKKERYHSSFNINCKNISLFEIFVILLSILQNLPQLKGRNSFSLYNILIPSQQEVSLLLQALYKLQIKLSQWIILLQKVMLERFGCQNLLGHYHKDKLLRHL